MPFAIWKDPDISYGPFGERNLCDIYRPANPPEPCPCVVFIHGGGFRGGNRTALLWNAIEWARLGGVAVTPTYRFWPDHLYPACIDDMQRLVRWLRAHADLHSIDPARIGAMGHSAGGHLGAFLGLIETRDNADRELARFSSRVRCVVDLCGPVEFVGMMSSASAPLLEGFIGKPLAEAESLYREASPVTHVASALDPAAFLIIHGEKDDGSFQGSVPLSASQALHRELRKVGAESELLVVPEVGHDLAQGNPALPAAKRIWSAALAFLSRHLGLPA